MNDTIRQFLLRMFCPSLSMSVIRFLEFSTLNRSVFHSGTYFVHLVSIYFVRVQATYPTGIYHRYCRENYA